MISVTWVLKYESKWRIKELSNTIKIYPARFGRNFTSSITELHQWKKFFLTSEFPMGLVMKRTTGILNRQNLNWYSSNKCVWKVFFQFILFSHFHEFAFKNSGEYLRNRASFNWRRTLPNGKAPKLFDLNLPTIFIYELKSKITWTQIIRPEHTFSFSLVQDRRFCLL